jgi:hypothetical protein
VRTRERKSKRKRESEKEKQKERKTGRETKIQRKREREKGREHERGKTQGGDRWRDTQRQIVTYETSRWQVKSDTDHLKCQNIGMQADTERPRSWLPCG